MKNDEKVMTFFKAILAAVCLYIFWRVRMMFSGVNDLEDVILLLCCVIAASSYWIGKCVLAVKPVKIMKNTIKEEKVSEENNN